MLSVLGRSRLLLLSLFSVLGVTMDTRMGVVVAQLPALSSRITMFALREDGLLIKCRIALILGRDYGYCLLNSNNKRKAILVLIVPRQRRAATGCGDCSFLLSRL